MARSAQTVFQLADCHASILRELLDLRLSSDSESIEWRLILQHLTRLRLGLDVDDDGAEGLAVKNAALCSSLQKLELLYPRYTTLYQMVAKLPGSLTELDVLLDLDAGDNKEEGVQQLNSGQLRALRVQDETGRRIPLAQLAAFTSLTDLELNIASPPAGDYSELTTLTRLTSLHLITAGDCQGVNSLTRLSRLADLHLTCSHPQPAGALATLLAGFPGLTTLNIDEHRDSVLGSSLCALTRPTSLTAYKSAVLREARALRGLGQLRRLDCSGCWSEESQLRGLSDLVGLSWLDLGSSSGSGAALSHQGLSWLTRMTALEVLLLCGSGSFRGGAFEQLAQLPALRALDLGGEQRSELPPLAPLERLQHLQWLGLPREYELLCQLPPRLAVPAMKGRRWESVYAFCERDLLAVPPLASEDE